MRWGNGRGLWKAARSPCSFMPPDQTTDVGGSPAPVWRSESFVHQLGDHLLRVSIALPMDIEPDVEIMVRGRKPVPVYVTDAAVNFPLVASTTRLMQWGGEVPPCIVVGIGYDDEDRALKEDWRNFDLTPARTTKASGRFGGGAALRRYLVETLKPQIERRFDVEAAQSVLAGHSLGGLFALKAMLEPEGDFGGYLAISPSLWFNRGALLEHLDAALEKGTIFSSRLAVFVGEQEERIASPKGRMTSNVLEVARRVAAHRAQFPNGALIRVVPGTTHHTISGYAFAQGLRFILAPEERRAETF
jgi:predicted alpha/beta superfamily hydrolase